MLKMSRADILRAVFLLVLLVGATFTGIESSYGEDSYYARVYKSITQGQPKEPPPPLVVEAKPTATSTVLVPTATPDILKAIDDGGPGIYIYDPEGMYKSGAYTPHPVLEVLPVEGKDNWYKVMAPVNEITFVTNGVYSVSITYGIPNGRVVITLAKGGTSITVTTTVP